MTAKPSPFLQTFVWIAAFVAILWGLEIIDWLIPGRGLDAFALSPRRFRSLPCILTAPFLHAGFWHLLSNTGPLLVLGALLSLGSRDDVIEASVATIVLGGGLLWLFGSPGHHLGASLLVFGWFGFIVARGFAKRSFGSLLLALVALALFLVPILSGLLPAPARSFEGHLFGLLAGGLSGFLSHRKSPRPKSAQGA